MGTELLRGADLRLVLEDVCSDVVRYLHASGRPDAFASVDIDREWNLGIGAFADLRVNPVDGQEYLVEIKTGYTTDEVIEHIRRKYARTTPRSARVAKVVIVAARADHPDWGRLVSGLRRAVAASIEIEIWDDEHVGALVTQLFGTSLPSLTSERDLVRTRALINNAKLKFAMGAIPTDPRELILADSLLWHFGLWRLRELRRAADGPIDGLVPQRRYERVVVIVADLCSFSSFVRDTPHEDVIRSSLTAFYSRARYQVINEGGMLYQFVGDEVSALFGIPDGRPGYVDAAFRAARSLLEIARSVMEHWQRRIDKLQVGSGIRIGMAMGDISLVAQRPLDVTRLGAFGATLNLAARLQASAEPNEIVISNVLKESISSDEWVTEPREPLEARNVGLIKTWRLRIPEPAGVAAFR